MLNGQGEVRCEKSSVFIFILFSSMMFNAAHAEERESLLGVAADPAAKTVSIEIWSTGCRDKSYFAFSLEGAKGDTFTFKRVKRDACKAMPHRTTITYSHVELGLKPDSNFPLGNKITLSENFFQVKNPESQNSFGHSPVGLVPV